VAAHSTAASRPTAVDDVRGRVRRAAAGRLADGPDPPDGVQSDVDPLAGRDARSADAGADG